jgi:hypothetical protein
MENLVWNGRIEQFVGQTETEKEYTSTPSLCSQLHETVPVKITELAK